ncbi:MAG: class I SAM-dependent methyltransferase [Gemmatimonadota bacterium]|nr:class I SAM-dependent methyltransferase [Gemmatimonadota bacterium]
METDVRLLPVLPDLLIDLWELGTSSVQIVSALQSIGVKPESRVLDLGCGKGAVAVALADRLDLQVEGVDAFPPFLQSARTLAREYGVSSKCHFRQDDIREILGQEGQYDAVLLLSVGPVSGDHRQTIAGLRTLVRQGGYIVIEDGFLADGIAALPGADGYAGRSETLRRLTAFGDELVRQVVCSADETRSLNERNTDLIRQRARLVKARHTDLTELIDEYVARQERETQLLGTDLICAIWVLRRV